ncbi:hypothetical protein [Staphylococcus phage vB_SauH_DELF3]|nr:hypothetical protein [Staphylococcus phage vB_SauH_DELF3]
MNARKIGDLLQEPLVMNGYKSNNYYRHVLKYSKHPRVKYVRYTFGFPETSELFKETKAFSSRALNMSLKNYNVKVVNKHLFAEINNILYTVHEEAEITREKKLLHSS